MTETKLEELTRISIHALREEGDMCPQYRNWPKCHFYPRPPRGGRRYPAGVQAVRQDFYPRPPRGGRLQKSALHEKHMIFLSTPSARRATGDGPGHVQHAAISIHALREEGDVDTARDKALQQVISIHAPREEGDTL